MVLLIICFLVSRVFILTSVRQTSVILMVKAITLVRRKDSGKFIAHKLRSHEANSLENS